MDVICSMRTVHKVQIHKVKPAAVQIRVYWPICSPNPLYSWYI